MVTWTEELGLVAVDLGGHIWTASEPTGEWNEVGRFPGTPAVAEPCGMAWGTTRSQPRPTAVSSA